MAHTIDARSKGKSIIRVVSAGTDTILLSDLAINFPNPQNTKNTITETVTSAKIVQMHWSAASAGSIIVNRGENNITTKIAELYNSGFMPLMQCGMDISQNSTGNISVTIATGGTLMLEVNKTATYSPETWGQ